MNTKVSYEWSVETLCEDMEDIIDSWFSDVFPVEPLEQNQRICLVRNEGNEMKGITDRYWAYLINGKLPEYFEDGQSLQTNIKVPVKYHNELNKYLLTPSL